MSDGASSDAAVGGEQSSRSAAPIEPLTSYHNKLFVFLGVASFFEGFDFIALTQVLPNVRAAMALSKREGGLLVAFIYLGTVASFLLVRLADRLGRRRVLAITIAGYTLCTFGTGLAPDVLSFAGMQFLARVFLVAEWALSVVYAAEEYPASRRGMVIGVLQGFSSFGSIVCAGVAPLLIHTRFGWRSVYFVGIVPLVVLAIFRRGLRESRRFSEQVGREVARRPLLRIWRTPYRGRMLKMAVIWGATYLCTQNAVTFFKEFAMDARGWDDAQVGTSVAIAAVASMPLVFYAGKLIDQIGRRRGAVVIFVLGTLGVLGSYGFHGRWALTGALVFGIFGASAVLPVLNAFTTELFPTELRGDAFAWSNNLLGRVGYVLGPAAVGIIAEDLGWGPAVQLTIVGPVLALILLLLWLPETRLRELEDTAAL